MKIVLLDDNFPAQFPQIVPEKTFSFRKEIQSTDMNFDGGIALHEYLLHQFQSVANVQDLCTRAHEHTTAPDTQAALTAVQEVENRIRAFKAQEEDLQQLMEGGSIQRMKARQKLEQLKAGPVRTAIDKAIEDAEAALAVAQGSDQSSPGTIWWIARSIEDRKKDFPPHK